MGRLHPKKGCDILIEAFAATLAQDPSWHLVMAGPNLDGWEKDLRKIASKLKIEDRITWTGMLQHEFKWGAIAASELLILPSHQENFGRRGRGSTRLWSSSGGLQPGKYLARN